MAKANLVKDVFLYGLADIITKGIAFFVFPIYTYIFTPEDFGVMALVITIGGLLGTISNIGMNNAVQRFYFEKTAAQSFVVSTGFWVSLIWSGITTFIFTCVLFLLKASLLNKFGIEFHYILLNLLSNLKESGFNISVFEIAL